MSGIKNRPILSKLLDGFWSLLVLVPKVKERPDKTRHSSECSAKCNKSRQIKQTLEPFGGRIVLHYLPPYSPDDNPIERFWEDFHAAVTRNHQCTMIDTLMCQADDYLELRSNQLPTSAQKAIAGFCFT